MFTKYGLYGTGYKGQNNKRTMALKISAKQWLEEFDSKSDVNVNWEFQLCKLQLDEVREIAITPPPPSQHKILCGLRLFAGRNMA